MAYIQRFSLVALGAIVSSGGFAQVKQPWTDIIPNGANTGFQGKMVAADFRGDVYVLQTKGGVGYPWSLNVFDPFGRAFRSFSSSSSQLPNLPAISLSVDYYSGSAFVVQSDGKNFGAVNGYLFDGYNWSTSILGRAPLAAGLDDNGILQIPCLDDSDGMLSLITTNSDGTSGSFVHDATIAPTFARVSDVGRVFVVGGSSPTAIDARAYDSSGALLWKRTYTNTATATYHIPAYWGDYYDIYAVNKTTNSGTVYTLHSVYPYQPATDVWSYGPQNGTVTDLTSDNHSTFIVAVYQSGSALSLILDGTFKWAVNTNPVGTLAAPLDGSGTALVSSFDPGTKLTSLCKYNATGGLNYTISYPATDVSDIGQIAWDTTQQKLPAAYYVGTDSAAAGSLYLTKILEGAALKSMSLPPSIVGGNPFLGGVTLSAVAPIQFSVNVSSLLPNVAHPSVSAIQIPASQTSGTFLCATFGVDKPTSVTLFAADWRDSMTSSAIFVNPASLSSLSMQPTSVTPDAAVTGTVSLNGMAGPSGIKVALSSNNAAATVPSQVTLPSNTAQLKFAVTTHPVSASTVVQIKAVQGSITKTANLTLNPVALSSLTPNPGTVVGGHAVSISANLTGNAFGSTVVALSSSKSAVLSVPASVTVGAGLKSFSFNATSSAVTSNTVVTITATYKGVSKQSVITVTP